MLHGHRCPGIPAPTPTPDPTPDPDPPPAAAPQVGRKQFEEREISRAGQVEVERGAQLWRGGLRERKRKRGVGEILVTDRTGGGRKGEGILDSRVTR
jgi:hypothetical protein